MWQAIVTVASLLLTIWTWYEKSNDSTVKVKIDLQKEADNAKTDSDVTRVFDDANRV